MTESTIMQALKNVATVYGNEYAIGCERLFRNETRHFKSSNFFKTFSPGMEAVKGLNNMPYGWGSLKTFWENNTRYAPIGLHRQVENTSALAQSRGERVFIAFPNVEAAMMTLCEFIRIKGQGWGRWFSKDKETQAKYETYLKTIKPRYCTAMGIV